MKGEFMFDDLKCCPFCGAKGYEKAIFIGWDDKWYWVVCDFCGGRGPKSDSHGEAVNKWNRRESK